MLPNLNSTLKYYEQNSGWIKPVIISDIFVRLHFALKTFSGDFFQQQRWNWLQINANDLN